MNIELDSVELSLIIGGDGLSGAARPIIDGALGEGTTAAITPYVRGVVAEGVHFGTQTVPNTLTQGAKSAQSTLYWIAGGVFSVFGL